MNMSAQELAQFAREAAEPHQVLLLALADMLDTVVEENDELSTVAVDLRNDVEQLERARDEWQSLAESLNATVKGMHR
jgi:uncharacterized coiled-coil DUF342 family protein